MPLQKQNINVNFAQGLNTKTDPFQVPPGQFLSLQNSVFTKGNLLQKRNGYAQLTTLPDTTSSFVTTFNGNLTAIGTKLEAFSASSNTWANKGSIQPAQLSTLSLIRSNTSQSQVDSATAENGLICIVYTDQNPASLGSPIYKYAILESATGQNIVAPTVIIPATGTVTGSPRVFYVGKYFMIVFTNVISATPHLQYIAINSTIPTSVTANTDISAQYTPSTTVNFDGVVENNALYLAWNGSDGGGAIRMTYIDSTLTQHNTVVFTGRVATLMSVCVDTTNSTAIIYAAFYDLASTTGYVLAVNQQLNTVLAPTLVIPSGTILNIASTAQSGVCTVLYEVSNNYSYDSSIPTHFINSRTCTQGGSLGTATTIVRSVGLASKANIVGTTAYFLGIYFSVNQPTYFLIDGSGHVVAKLAYSNSGSYYTKGLPSMSVDGTTLQIPYLIKDLIEPVNKDQGAPASAAIYSQTGLNLVTINLEATKTSTSEIAQNLYLSGGFLWMYDGYAPVEQGFFVWPDNVEVTSSTTGGVMTAQQYFYQAIYEWTDNQGNIYRSAPSIPVSVTTTGSTSSVTINVPTLRLTYKTANPVKIVIFRWSAAQQTYYQVTSTASPVLNSTTTDSVSFVDTLADSSIIGNSIIYTTGGVVENIGPPACSDVSLFKSRLFLIDSEDDNILWYSKQVIESVPVEMSDLFTIFVAPTTGAQGSTSGMKCTAPLDDKLIIFKRDAIYYIAGNGPDNTGANNDFSEPVFITSTVGCSNKSSIVFMPQGLMFQSDKGIWLLDRSLQTSYIGAAVEAYNSSIVQSAINIPGTNQVRFTLSNGITLMYDYYYNQWGSFTGIPAISSTLYQNMHTYINSAGQLFQENPGSYLDGSTPVLMSFTTGWFNLAGLQGFQRAYFFYMLGTYASPHKLNVQIAYDFSIGPSQSSIIIPKNQTPAWGGDTLYGGSSAWGGVLQLEKERIFFEEGKCESFQISITEAFDSSYGVPAGAGLTISGLNIVAGLKKGYSPISAAQSVG